MRKKLNVLALAGLACLLGAQAAQASPITFSEVALGTTDPTINNVHFFAGDPVAFNDTYVADFLSPGNAYLMNGIDDGTGSAPGLFNTFIGATAQGGLIFSSVSLDALIENTLPTGAAITLSAYKNGVKVADSTLAIGDNDYHSLSVADAGGFDTLYISDGVGDYFHIDNFDYTRWSGGGNPVPEPCTMLLLGTGLTGLVMRRRKKA